MDQPTLTDYAHLIITLFDKFVQTNPVVLKYQNLCTYKYREMMLFFMIMQFRRIHQFKTQHDWLVAHPEMQELLGFETVPHRTTISRQFKKLGDIVGDFVAFVGGQVADLDEAFANNHLAEDKSLFKADGPVWHQSDRQEGRIPPKLRRLDTDATWDKSGYHGWVYGYGVHLTSNQAGFPKLLEVETAAYSEKQALAAKENTLLDHLQPDTLTGDDGYTKALRIRRWAQRGVVLLTPALRWFKGRYARAYHAYIQQPDNAALLRTRQTAIEPFFDLLAQVVGATDNHKQLPLQRLVNVRTCLALGVLTIQIAMIANNIWNLPFRSISHIRVCFS